MNARFPYLFALALALPLASCRFVGMKPDFSVLGDALSPVEADKVHIEQKPGAATKLSSYKRPTPAPPPTAAPAAGSSGASLFSQQQGMAQVQAPAPSSSPRPAATPAVSAGGLYTVRPGDSLARIARLHKVPLGSLAAVNGIDLQNPLIKPGQQLRIPQGSAAIIAPPRSAMPPAPAAAPKPTAAPAPMLTLKPVRPQAAPAPATAARPAAKAAAAPATRVTPAPAGTYRVCAGDTLYRIARKHGITLKELLRANKLSEEGARNVRVGTLLTIPTKP